MTFEAFFNPRGVVVIGASTQPHKLGYGVARNLVASGYTGALHFVNPRGGSLFSRPLWPSLDDVPDPIDLAILVVPAAAAPATIRACGQRGIPAAVLISGGFREVGAEGAALEEAVAQAARETGIRLIGPNCIGLLDTHLPLDTTFLPPPMPRPGDLAFLSHSGATCAAVIDWAREQGFGFSRLVSLGNQVDVNETDLLPLMAADVHTRVITCYFETISDGQRFVSVAAEVTQQKPVVVLKAGRSAAGQRAAASHTGALAGEERAVQAALEKAGVLRATTVEEMFDWARALAWQPLPRGPRTAVLTNAGGPGVLAADALAAEGLQLADLQPQTQEALRAFLPPAASVRNPVDMLASASAEDYARALSLLLADPGVDSVLVILPPPPMYPAEQAAEALIAAIGEHEKPVLVALMGSTLIHAAAQRFRAARIPDYPFPERAAAALARMWQRQQFLQRPQDAAGRKPLDMDKARAALAGMGPGWLPPERTEMLMQAAGIPFLALRLAQTAEEAASLAASLGFPVVMKIASPDIPHKTDVGGILLNVADAEAAASGFTQMLAKVRAQRPSARLQGVWLQRQLPPGQEIILGVVRDPQFGPLVMFGSGGVEVEGLGDVAFALAPLNDWEAENLLARTWAGRKLAGYRNLPPADREAVRQALQQLGDLALALPQIAEIEINPLLAWETGVAAVDVRVRLI